MIYLDTSALIKRYIVEKGSNPVRDLLRQEGSAATATVAYAEIYSGLTRRFREGYVSPKFYAIACHEFEQDWSDYLKIELTRELLVVARDLIQRHPLRSFDAIHLASALSLMRKLGEGVTIVAADGRLLHAAAAEGLLAVNVEKEREA